MTRIKQWKSDLGAVAVETVLVSAFILVPLLAGIVDVGRAIHLSITLREVAQEAAVFAAFEGAGVDATRQRAVDATPFPAFTTSNVSASCVDVPRASAPGSRVTVEVTFPYQGVFMTNLTLGSEATVEGSAPCGSGF